jgi:hypothetical protein
VAAGSGEEDPQPETYLLRHYEVIFSGLIKGGLAYWIVLQHFDLQSNGRGLPTFKNPRAATRAITINAFTCGSNDDIALCYNGLAE